MGTTARVARFGLLGRTLLAGVPVAVATALTTPALARIESFPAGFRTQMVQTNGTRLHVRVGGKGPAVVLLHGFGDTGDMWAPLAKVLVKDHTVIVPDLPGIGDWDNIIRSPVLWHFNFRGPDVERLVKGRERIYLDRFWNELSADPM